CQIDGAPFAACVSPKEYDNLTDGQHTFEVRAVDGLGVDDPTPEILLWTVDATKPVLTFTGGPAEGSTSCPSATFQYSCGEPSSVECDLDNAPLQPCSATSKSYSNLPGGPHSFSARCTDTVGNVGLTVTRNWSVDATPPDTSIQSPAAGAT